MSALSRVQGFHKASYSHMETCIAKDFDVTEVQVDDSDTELYSNYA